MGRRNKVFDIQHQQQPRKGWRITREDSFLARTLLRLKNLCLKKQKQVEKENERTAVPFAAGSTTPSRHSVTIGKVHRIYKNVIQCCYVPKEPSLGETTWETPVEVIDIKPEKQWRSVATQTEEIQERVVTPEPSSRRKEPKTVTFSKDLMTRYYTPTPPLQPSDSEDSLTRFIDPCISGLRVEDCLDDNYDRRWEDDICPAHIRRIEMFWVPLNIPEDGTNYICQAMPASMVIYGRRRHYKMQQRRIKQEKERHKDIVTHYECGLLMNRMLYQIESLEYGFRGAVNRTIKTKIDNKREELMSIATNGGLPEQPTDD